MAYSAKNEIVDAIASFERATGLSLTMHDLDGCVAPYLKSGQQRHDQPLCRLVKQSLEGWRCYDLEVTRLRQEWSQWPNGRIHRCHAGLIEWVVPMAWEGRLVGVVFAGQARGSDRCCDKIQVASASIKKWSHVSVAKQLEDDEAQHLLEQLRQFASRLLLWMIQSGASQNGQQKRSRRAEIEWFIDEHHAQLDFCLADLADHMNLSESRIAHLVRELFGRSFVQMVTAARLSHASDLLNHTDLPIRNVALESGFNDSTHFHRVFKKYFGVTPRRYRYR